MVHNRQSSRRSESQASCYLQNNTVCYSDLHHRVSQEHCYVSTSIKITNHISNRYELIFRQNYQLHDKPESTLNMKVKGYGFILSQSAVEKSISTYNISEYLKNELLVSNSAAKKVIFDAADYIIPQNQNMQAFIMTNFDLIVQSIGSCSEYNPMSNVKQITENSR